MAPPRHPGLAVTALLATLGLALAGCTGLRPSAPATVPWEQRLAMLRAIGQFQVEGRLAATDGTNGFSAGLRWQQQGEAATIDLTAPLGIGAAHIERNGSDLRVTTSQGEVLEGPEASTALATTLGFEPPLAALGYWVLGASDPSMPAEETLDDQQRLIHLEQDGWQIDYADYEAVQRQWLPQRVLVARDRLHLKLFINAWRL